MKNYVMIALVIVANLSMLLFACNEAEKQDVTTLAPTQEQLRQKGEYLVNAMGCDDCHTPKKMGLNGPEIDVERRFSGHPADVPLGNVDTSMLKNWVFFAQGLTAAAGSWGVSYAANITSDETGIGNWTEAQFFKAIREGKSKGLDGARPLLPPMPWPMYKNLSNEDLRSIYTFLKSTKPVRNVVPAPHPIDALNN